MEGVRAGEPGAAAMGGKQPSTSADWSPQSQALQGLATSCVTQGELHRGLQLWWWLVRPIVRHCLSLPDWPMVFRSNRGRYALIG